MRFFSNDQKDQIRAAYNNCCAVCGTMDKEMIEADHFIPHSKGGKTTICNGIALCGPCNRIKANKSILAYYKPEPRQPIKIEAQMFEKISLNRAAFRDWISKTRNKKHPALKFIPPH